MLSPLEGPDATSPSNDRPDRRVSYPVYNEPDVPYPSPSPNHVSAIESEGPEVVATWVYDQERVNSPLSTDGTVVSSYPVQYNEKGEPIGLSVSETSPEKTKSRRRTWWLCGLGALILLILIGVGLGVGLTLGLKKSSKGTSPSSSSSPSDIEQYCAENPQYCIGGSIDSRYYSTTGAFNGSGIAVAGESWDKATQRYLTVYFQHHTGTLRWLWQDSSRNWNGGTTGQIVANDAKNATPISVVAYVVDGNTANATAVHHLFYVTTENLVKEIIKRNRSIDWEDGPLNNLSLNAYNSPSIGLQACWYGNYYGDDSIAQSGPISESTPGINLWYPYDESKFQLYGWYRGASEWKLSRDQGPWQSKNTHAGVGCYSWGKTYQTTYAMMVNQYNAVEVWWRDTNKTSNATDAHPTNSWVNASGAAIPGVYPSTSLGYTEFLITQMEDGSIKGHNITWAAENSSISDTQTFTIRDQRGPLKGLNGTHLTNTAIQTTSNGQDLNIFYQTNGSNIMMYSRDLYQGSWTSFSLYIPDK